MQNVEYEDEAFTKTEKCFDSWQKKTFLERIWPQVTGVSRSFEVQYGHVLNQDILNYFSIESLLMFPKSLQQKTLKVVVVVPIVLSY